MAEQLVCEKGHSAGVQKGDNFCYLCGSKINTVNPECSCGRQLSSHDVFCPNCGKKVK